MTKEELWIEADKYVTTTGNNDCTIDAYIASAEPREKRIAELEQQIEKMKCCANCKSFKGYGETCEGWGEPVLNLNCDCTEWELRR